MEVQPLSLRADDHDARRARRPRKVASGFARSSTPDPRANAIRTRSPSQVSDKSTVLGRPLPTKEDRRVLCPRSGQGPRGLHRHQARWLQPWVCLQQRPGRVGAKAERVRPAALAFAHDDLTARLAGHQRSPSSWSRSTALADSAATSCSRKASGASSSWKPYSAISRRPSSPGEKTSSP